MSPTDWNMPGIKGKRIPGRPGRFDPSEPLHMTTRRAAKKGPNDESPPLNGSVGDDESRRGSFDDLRPITSHSNGSHFSLKSRRPSEVSVQMNSPEFGQNGIPSSEERKSSATKPVLSPIQQTPSPSRKRKRSLSTTPPESTEQPPVNGFVDNESEAIAKPSLFENVDDAVEVVRPEQLSDREPSENASLRSEDGQYQQGESFASQSMDVSPVAYLPDSPGSNDSRSPDGLPLAKPLEEALNNIVQNAQEEEDEDEEEVAEAADEMEVDVDGDVDMDVDADVEGAEDADDAEEQIRSDDDERPARRFGGRRRARHPIPKVEKAMQRQAQLKSAYRAIARAQKAVLAEIAQRTIENLETSPELHTEAMEYHGVRQGLDEALDERKYRLQAQHELNIEQLQKTLESEQRAVKAKCQHTIPDAADSFITRMKHEMIMIARQARMNGVDVDYVTDDEDDSIPKLRRVKYRQDGAPDNLLDSRSRLILESEIATDNMEKRFEMQKLLQTLEEDDIPEELKQRTVMDETPRHAANARRSGIEGTNTLAAAAAEFERKSNIPIIRNEDALGLQLLGDLASRPSIKAPLKQNGERAGRRTLSRPMPPHLQIPSNYQQPPIPLEMSPRTTLAMGDRFENSMPPPATPRQRPGAFMRSPDAMRVDQPLQSPTMNANRFNEPQPFSARTPDRRPESRREVLPEYNNGFQDQRPRSEHKQEAQFSPPHPGERRMDNPLWRDYSRDYPPAIERRGSSARDRPPFNFAAHAPLRDERHSMPDQRRDTQEAHEPTKDEFSPYGPLHSRPMHWADLSSRPGAADFRTQDQRSPIRETGRPQSPSRSRNSSFSVQDFRPGLDLHKDSNHRQKHRSSKSGSFSHKTSREEREGLSRRHWSNQQRKFSRSMPKPGSAGSPTVAASSAGSPIERVNPPPWHGPPQPQHSPSGVPPPPAAYQQSPYSQPPPPPSFPPSQQGRDYYHRNSFPRPASSTYDRLPPTPLYVVPQPHPPPPGVPPEQYNRPFAPPPPPGYQPPPPPQTPQTPYPPPASGPYGQQFGGPPLAPAGTNSGYQPGFRPAPAFAQQAQQQQQNTFGPRRRTQSDASQFAKFQPWNPPTVRR